MDLKSHYRQFLIRPTLEALASDASIHYVPTLISVSESGDVMKHLKTQAEYLSRKENILNSLESGNTLCVEAETTVQFLLGGGAFLPNLDENFIADKTITFPVIHFVTYTKDVQIQQIRMMWDQGSVLKMVDVIGSRGRNWPLNDGPDQIKLISSALDSASTLDNSLSSSMKRTSVNDSDNDRAGRSHTRGVDKHASLSLFDQQQSAREESPANAIGRATTAKPPPRDLQDLFVDGDLLPEGRDQSPSKGLPRNALKGGAGKNYHANRLFDEEDPVDLTKSPDKNTKKPHPNKYNHFEFGDPVPQPSSNVKNTKHMSKWNFEDFNTPEPPRTKRQYQQERNFGWSDDEEEAKKPQEYHQRVPQPRRDTNPQGPHFEYDDEATPTANRPIRSRDGGREGMGLYEDHVIHQDPTKAGSSGVLSPHAGEKMPLGNITNVNKKGLEKNFGSQFDIQDESPTGQDRMRNENTHKRKESHDNANHRMQSSWDVYEHSPDRPNWADGKPGGIKTHGDGMGGRKNPTEKSWWEYGE
ncbi:MAG: hypothetical protein M1831_007277 [Alyxoria varia]|nr:MAG: hypothetical protein M1831_007277 [Alyxoria varia]